MPNFPYFWYAVQINLWTFAHAMARGEPRLLSNAIRDLPMWNQHRTPNQINKTLLVHHGKYVKKHVFLHLFSPWKTWPEFKLPILEDLGPPSWLLMDPIAFVSTVQLPFRDSCLSSGHRFWGTCTKSTPKPIDLQPWNSVLQHAFY